MKARAVAFGDLGDDLVLAPERHVAALDLDPLDVGSPPRRRLGDLVRERGERAAPRDAALVLDTTHAKDGLLDVHAAAQAARAGAPARSAKKLVREGDVIVSRLRPYLRQIALVHGGALALAGRPLAVSSEFYVLAPREEHAEGAEDADRDVAWLVPFLLGDAAQRALAAAQEGGHHPRVPRASLFALRVPDDVLRARVATSRAVHAALDDVYRGLSRWASALASGRD